MSGVGEGVDARAEATGEMHAEDEEEEGDWLEEGGMTSRKMTGVFVSFMEGLSGMTGCWRW